MNDSLVQPDCSITSSDTITIDTSSWISGTVLQDGSIMSDTITLTNSNSTGSSYYYNTGAGAGGSLGTITISGGGSGGTTIGSLGTTSFNWKMPEEFVDAFPDYEKIQKMCKAYPALEIAMRNFKTVYDLVKDDYDSPTPKK